MGSASGREVGGGGMLASKIFRMASPDGIHWSEDVVST